MIPAITGDKDFIHQIKHSKINGFVHSTFNRTFNFQCIENGELYTIACSEMDNGPNSLVIEVDSFEKMNIEINDNVWTENNRIFISNKMVIKMVNVRQWESILPKYPTDNKTLKINLAKMKNYIEMHGKSGGMKQNSSSQKTFDSEVSRMLNERTNLLIKELQNNQMLKALQHAISLIGLGPGLTPSGDDFLVGLFTILKMKNSPCSSYQSFCEEVVKIAKTLTNDISYMALKKASVGKVRESIILLIDHLINGNEEELLLSLNKVLKIGSSSGTDIALGLIAGIEINLKDGGK
ncbi:DUF2877 domain-containing protein [Cytobacillus sp. FJAT-53684]|uniref:DUF2877 domain-containing protein n=1 Tax=Cytobacillus mangrovibacter TaxID=3299024 RepID=A0ABW6K2R9_9BACI